MLLDGDARADQSAPTSRLGMAGAPPPAIGIVLVAAVATAMAGAGLVVAVADGPLVIEVVRPAVVALWAVAGAVLAMRRTDRLGAIIAAGAVAGGAGTWAAAAAEHQTFTGGSPFAADAVVRLAVALLAAVALHLLVALPDGRLATTTRRMAVAAGYAAAAVVGVSLLADRSHLIAWPLVALWLLALAAGLSLSHDRYETAGAVDRRRLQWFGWGVAVATEAALVVAALRLLSGWPDHVSAIALALTVLLPFALIAGTFPRMVARVDHLLTHTVAVAGLTALVVAIYVLVVLGLGRTPDSHDRALLLLSMVAAGLAALLYLPARRWLTERANRLVYGEREAPDATLRTFGQHLTRALPMDELLLQLAEGLRKSMTLASAEVWTGGDGRYELAAGVPHRHPAPIEIGRTELPVVARAGVSGGTWLDIWLPALVGPDGSSVMRVAPVAHGGELLGLIVLRRSADSEAFNEAEDGALSDLARQFALALHNMKLDSALQASLEELKIRNAELQRSRARIVAAGDAERRKLERNLHDGAQQHLVALAIKLRLAGNEIDDHPDAAKNMIGELGEDVHGAIQELRSLAHGIFPPLLVSSGLNDALLSAAGRAALPTSVDATSIGRYRAEVEAAVYFCILEALQNAGKHAGESATVAVQVGEDDGTLWFEVADDGVGFDTDGAAAQGHGFVNMTDRLGAFGGSLTVRSTVGLGTTIRGTLPLGPGTPAPLSPDG
jgi:signal transduction histidine kinase